MAAARYGMVSKAAVRTGAAAPAASAPHAPRTARVRPRALWSTLTPATTTRLAKLGIASAFDLVLHLPLRYDDETKLYPINAAPAGQPVLVEGKVARCEVKYRPKRQLVCHIPACSHCASSISTPVN